MVVESSIEDIEITIGSMVQNPHKELGEQLVAVLVYASYARGEVMLGSDNGESKGLGSLERATSPWYCSIQLASQSISPVHNVIAVVAVKQQSAEVLPVGADSSMAIPDAVSFLEGALKQMAS